ncbi:hypothetical protein WJX73_008351 [Symbiochloris irregularis]|uniref:Magnesium transporter n=1 Tax=Symbiochloris irregularis TaxID=706552 RepID=A0AAW1P4N2_9CHLO
MARSGALFGGNNGSDVTRASLLPTPAETALKTKQKSGAIHVGAPRGWLKLDGQGRITHVQVDKHGLVMQFGVPYRDLRMLDPLVPMPYPSSIFIREKALVVNLESIRMLICDDQVYVLSVPAAGQPGNGRTPDAEHYFIRDLVVRLQAGQVNPDGSPLNRESMNMHLDRHMPYELRALECALAVAVRILSRDCAELDAEARSPLERLTHKVTKIDLQRVRNVKSIMNKLMGRVGRIKQELERILDDDEDMADMYLGRRRQLEALEEMTNHTTSPRRMSSLAKDAQYFSTARPKLDSESAEKVTKDSGTEEILLPGETAPIKIPKTHSEDRDPSTRRRSTEEGDFQPHSHEEAAAILEHLDDIRRNLPAAGVDPHDIEACEALLESYFMQVDYLMNGLVMLKEHVDDTEDLINIELDNRRNELVALNVVVGITTASITLIAAVASIFGMNLYPLPISDGPGHFIAVVTISCGVALLCWIGVLLYARAKRLLFVGTPAHSTLGGRNAIVDPSKYLD